MVVRTTQLCLCLAAGLAGGMLAASFEGKLDNPVGFLVVVLAPLAFGVVISAPHIARNAASNGFATAVAAAIPLAAGVESRSEDGGGPLVFFGTLLSALLLMSLPLLAFKLGAMVYESFRFEK